MTNLIGPPTGQEGQDVEYGLQIFQEFIKWAGVFLIGYITHFFVCRRDAETRRRKWKDDFLSIVAEQATKLQSSHDETKFFVESKPILSQAVNKMEIVLPKAQWGRLNNILNEYKAQDQSELHRGIERRLMLQHVEKGANPQKERLADFLKRFSDCVKG